MIKNEKVGLYGDYSYPLTFANVGKPNWSSGREIKVRRCLFTFSIQREIRHFHVVVVKKRQRNVEKKKCDARAKLLFCLLDLLHLFLCLLLLLSCYCCCFCYFDVLVTVASLNLEVPKKRLGCYFSRLCTFKSYTTQYSVSQFPKSLNPFVFFAMLRRYSTGLMNGNTETPTKIEAIAHTVRQPYFFFRQNIEETQGRFRIYYLAIAFR